MDEDLQKRNEKIEYHPIINHFYTGCLWEVLAYSYEHGCQNQQHLHTLSVNYILTDAWWLWQLFSYSEVNSNNSLKVGSFEVVSAVADDVEEDGGHVDGHEGARQPSSQNNLHFNRVIWVSILKIGWSMKNDVRYLKH